MTTTLQNVTPIVMTMRAQAEAKLAGYGLNKSSRDWVLKAVDPAAPGESAGIPDESARSVMRPEYVVQSTISPPSGAASWDCYIWSLPGDVNTLFWAAADSAGGPVDFSSTTLPPTGTFGSIALQGNVDGTGTYSAVVLDPVSNSVQSFGFGIRTPTSSPLTFRHQYKSITIDLVAAAVNDKGDVYAAQYPFDTRQRGLRADGLQTTPAGSAVVSVASVIALPFSESDLTLSCRNPYVGRAKDGVYMPLRLTGPDQPFADVESPICGNYLIAGTDSAPERWLPMLMQSRTGQFGALVNIAQDDGYGGVLPGDVPWPNQVNRLGGRALLDTGYDNTSVGVCIFRNLAGGSGGSFSATLMVKVIVGLEVCPRPTTADRVYARAPARYEPRAIEAYYALANEMASAYPSKFNSLGMLMPVLSSLATRLFGPLAAGARAFGRELLDGPEAPRATPKPQIKPSIRTRSSSVRSRTSVKIRAPRRKRK